MFKELLISGAIVLLSGYRYYMHKPEDIECVSYEVKSRKIPKVFDKFKIVQISDLHNRSFGIDNSILLEKIDKLKPDIVCITGDLIDGANEDFSIALKLIDELSRKYQVYHIIGNHEQKVMFNKYKELYKEYFKQLNAKNIINLENEMVKIERDSKCINIYGLVIPYKYYPYLFNRNYKNKSLDFNKYDVEKRLGKIDNREYNILLVHTPFFFEGYSKWGADLVLAGHVHGGIIRLPIKGGLLSPNREFFPKYDLGEYNMGKSTMILSKGLGGSKVLPRVNCKPEIVEITLKSK
ncbi:MAG: metallophosphoesterase [Romboutsia timonensis]|uniref:metallophosphoesterase n=1 Tax=Romboutsia timonensis TaxID=1776391 RepID=UPI002A75BAD9|nr:metallophosphoesterase [Romboutsia timonensis]MDY2882359.1 metallophosphoesterase [Romboutsia timonensis]